MTVTEAVKLARYYVLGLSASTIGSSTGIRVDDIVALCYTYAYNFGTFSRYEIERYTTASST